jgi:hypothetical protein
MKDITTTSFGLVIAYLVPGMTGLYGLALWIPDLQKMFTAFLTAESNVGLFLLVVIAALVAGLLVNGFRWIIFERWRSDSLKAEEMAKLGKDDKILAAYLERVDENYRHHQAYGGLGMAWPILYSGWLAHLWPSLSCCRILWSLLPALAIETVIVLTAKEALKRHTNGARELLRA